MMKLKFLKKYNFYTDFFEKNNISNVYETISLKINQKKIFSSKNKNHQNRQIKSFELVPDYLNYSISKNLINSRVFQKKGYAIFLDSFPSNDHYIKSQLNTSGRKNVIRSLNRLETCFNIEYKAYYGYITKVDYDYYMNAFYKMLDKRFQERNDRNPVLENWNYYLETIFDLLNKKKAFIFLVNSNNKPIAFSINYLFDTICYSSIASFDSDYYKFSLGSTEIYKLIEWCINNNFKILDLGYGDFPHKRLWSNTTYNFENHIIYSPKSFIAKIYATYTKSKYKLINYLISKKVNLYYNNFKTFITGRRNSLDKSIVFNITTTKLSNFDLKNFKSIDLKSIKYSFLKKPIYEFLYSNKEHINDILVYKIIDEPNTFIIKGQNNQTKIEVNN